MDDAKHCIAKCSAFNASRVTLIETWNNLPLQENPILHDADLLDRVLHVIPPPPALASAWIKINEALLKIILRAKR